MLQAIKKILGLNSKVELEAIIKQGAVIIDVRTPGEYTGGHIKGSINIPLNMLQGQAAKLDKQKPIITCCASGMRSGSARSMLLAKGFTEVYNGGSWHNLRNFEK